MNFNREIMNRRKWQKKKGRRKIIFYIFPIYLYSFLSLPSSNSPLRAYPQGYCFVCLPSLRGKELGRASWVTFYLLPYIDRTDAIHEILSKHFRTCFSRRYLCLGSVGHILRLEGTCLCSVRITCRSPVTTLASYLIKVTIIITIYTCHWEE